MTEHAKPMRAANFLPRVRLTGGRRCQASERNDTRSCLMLSASHLTLPPSAGTQMALARKRPEPPPAAVSRAERKRAQALHSTVIIHAISKRRRLNVLTYPRAVVTVGEGGRAVPPGQLNTSTISSNLLGPLDAQPSALTKRRAEVWAS